jgi:hypothetical protein
MTVYIRFGTNVLLALVLLTFTAASVFAQTATAISFDALPRAKGAAAPAVAPSPSSPSAPARAKGDQQVAKLRKEIAALQDSVVTLQHATHTAVVVTVPALPPVASTTPATQAPAPAPTPAPAPAPAPAPNAAAPKAPAAPSFQTTSVAGLLQVQLTGGDGTARSTYRIRRAELKLTSDLGRRAQGVVMVDVSKALSLSASGTETTVNQSTRVLQDALISVPLHRVQVDAGQQRVPLGLEGTTSAANLETIDRALMESSKARGASFGDVRDLGVAARGTWKQLDGRLGLFNGTGETMNDADKNAAKSGAAIIGWRPAFVQGLRVGASGATSGAATGDKPARDRVGVDVRYAHDWLTLQSEAMTGRDGSTTRRGMYALVGIAPIMSVKFVARFDGWDPDARKESTAADVTERDYLGGATWLPQATRLKLQIAVVRKTFTYSLAPSTTLLLTQLQASW